MRKTIFKELVVYVVLLLVLAIAMHPDFFVTPVDRLAIMVQRQNYIHPFVYALLVYLLVYMFRIFIKIVFTLFKMANKR